MTCSGRRAAIDIGTVTTRLLIAETGGGTLREIARRTIVTHLGEGLLATGALALPAIDRVAGAVRSFLVDIERAGVDGVLAVATSAARDASNGRAFLDAIERLGVRPRIISGSTEARLSFVGATHGLQQEDVLVADLGGGSTELVFGSARGPGGGPLEIEAARSLDVGARRVLDMFLHSDPPTRTELTAASRWIVEELRPYFESLRARPRMLITLAGTGTTLSAITQRMRVYDPSAIHGSLLSGGDVADMREDLAAMTVEARREVIGMDPARAEVIVAGALILEEIMALAGLDTTVVSEHDILYGLVLEGI